ncbi:MAG: DUF4389 domain-containing protein [Maritimibacter sp.]
MTKSPKKKSESDAEVDPQVLEEPEAEEMDPDWDGDDNNVWMRGLWMLVLAFLFGVGETILVIAAVLQFLWLLFGKEKNKPIADFGKDLSHWLAQVALFQTGSTEDKPFPFSRWGGPE